jgi:chromosome segregation ATPase
MPSLQPCRNRCATSSAVTVRIIRPSNFAHSHHYSHSLLFMFHISYLRVAVRSSLFQVESTKAAWQSSTTEVKRLTAALARREEEILKYARKSGALDATAGEDEMRIQNLIAADSSNQRIIEQLNGQVDFLNEHLALRERQLAEGARQIAGVRELKAECEYRWE